jgi:hypothetical protein
VHGNEIDLKFTFINNKNIEVIRADERVFNELRFIRGMVDDLGGYGIANQEEISFFLRVRNNSFKVIISILKLAIYMLDKDVNLDENDGNLQVVIGKLIKTDWSWLPLSFHFETMKTAKYIDAPILENDLSKIIVENIRCHNKKLSPELLVEIIKFAHEHKIKNILSAAVERECYEEYITDPSFFKLHDDLKAFLIKHIELQDFLYLMRINEKNLAEQKELEILYKIGLEIFMPDLIWQKGYSARDMFYLPARSAEDLTKPKILISAQSDQTYETKHGLILQEILARKNITGNDLIMALDIALELGDQATIEKLLDKKTFELTHEQLPFVQSSDRKQEKRRKCSIQ